MGEMIMEEKGWLIERKKPIIIWLCSNGKDFDWTNDSSRALRFSRQQDAQSLINYLTRFCYNHEWEATEHIWADGIAGSSSSKYFVSSNGDAPEFISFSLESAKSKRLLFIDIFGSNGVRQGGLKWEDGEYSSIF